MTYELLTALRDLLSPAPFRWAVCGGRAIDLFCGVSHRAHVDVDVQVFWPERDQVIRFMRERGYTVYEMLGNGLVHRITDLRDQRCVKRNIFCVLPDCELVTLQAQAERDMFLMDFSHQGLSALNYVEFLFNRQENGDLVYARNPAIRLSLTRALLRRDNLPFLAPEMTLLYKSTDTAREVNLQDLRSALPRMDEEQRQWLRQALVTAYPDGHPWLAHLG